MTKKILLLALCSLLLALGFSAQAQEPKKVPRIGFVSGASGDASNPGPQVEAFRQGMRDLGYVEGKNIRIEYRYIEGKSERIPSFVAELVQLKVDVLVVTNPPSTRAAKQTTKTIPVVIVTTADPVATGIIDSLARPGGNITGLTRLTRELSGKRLELLQEAFPRISRVGVLWTPGTSTNLKEYEPAAHALMIPLESLELHNPKRDLDGAFQVATRANVNGLIIITTATLYPYRKQIAELAKTNRLPSMFEGSEWVNAGGLMSYSANEAESFRRAAIYVDKILKGAKPADLPVEQPTKFELVINLKTAKQIGVTIPQRVLARADKVIK